MGASLLLHIIVFLTLALAPLPWKSNPSTEFENEKVTFYKLSQNFPDLSPLPTKSRPFQPKHGPTGKLSPSPESRNETEISINRAEKGSSELHVELPEASQLSALPKLELPNILMRRPKTDAGEAPISVVPQADRDIVQEAKKRMTEISQALGTEPSAPGPLPIHQSPYLEGRNLTSNNRLPSPALRLDLLPPVEPSTASPQVSQLKAQSNSLSAGAPLLLPRPVENPVGNGAVKQLPTQSGTATLVYSPDPVLPKGELRIPKVNVPGNIKASPQGAAGKGGDRGTPEFGNGSIAIPGVSIKNRLPLVGAETGVAVVQAPKPVAPLEEGQRDNKPKAISPDRLLPSFNQILKVSSLEYARGTLPTESPLREVEREGKPIYTAAINAPNFTSKRGSWIFRFAELPESSILVDSSLAPGSRVDPPADSPLTAPSASTKVDPRYPPDVVRDKVEGVVVLFAIIRKTGSVDPDSIQIVRKLDPRLDLSAREALLQWKFKPSQKNGHPVDIQAEISIPFNFRRDSLYP
jgi:TonB family protein